MRQNTPETERETNLVDEVELLCLDAGNTVVFLDHAAVSAAARAAGFELEVGALVTSEGEAKRRLAPNYQRAEGRHTHAHEAPLEDEGIPQGWSAFMRTMVSLAGALDEASSAACVRALWAEHLRFNLWRRVPEGLRAALDELRAAGVRVCVVSNSEGHLDELFERVGLAGAFDHVIDSALVGVEKPDPRIFAMALERFGVGPERALHLGDTAATDVDGARRAGLRVGLIDPWAHYEGMLEDVPRVEGVNYVARALLAARARRTG